jgi:hypothetical protein
MSRCVVCESDNLTPWLIGSCDEWDKDVIYDKCAECGVLQATSMLDWSVEKFKADVYNDRYGEVDPDFESKRPRNMADSIDEMFADVRHVSRHIDYGGGSGLLSQLLREKGWDSRSYDKFYNTDSSVLGSRYNFISCIEVVEHVPDQMGLFAEFDSLLEQYGMIFISTKVSDHSVPAMRPYEEFRWWYANPRAGHVVLHSYQSLRVLAKRIGLNVVSITDTIHIMGREIRDRIELAGVVNGTK